MKGRRRRRRRRRRRVAVKFGHWPAAQNRAAKVRAQETQKAAFPFALALRLGLSLSRDPFAHTQTMKRLSVPNLDA